LGRKFTVRTDHAALQWLRNIPEPVGQQARWLGAMEEYEFSIVHRPGTKHGNADAMSRRPLCQRTRCCPSRGVITNHNQEENPETPDEHRLAAAVTLSSGTVTGDQHIEVGGNERQNHAYGGQPGNTDINVEGSASYLSLDDFAMQQIKDPDIGPI